MVKVTETARPPAVGIIGAGQLARMMVEAASSFGIRTIVLAANSDDAACESASEVIIGSATDATAYDELARRCDVITLDHELVDLTALARLEASGVAVLPSPASVRFAAEKDYQRLMMAKEDIVVPDFLVIERFDENVFVDFCGALGAAPVVKSARGGYDGRGVVVAVDIDDATRAVRRLLESGPVILEEPLELLGEYAVVVVTSRTGERRQYPLVRTVQFDSMCAEVHFPSGLGPHREDEARELADRVADVVGAVGILAVEMFLTDRGFVLNEVATRPHNSGHWTIEGAVTSQFENHLRAVLGLPLGATRPVVDAAAMVNVVGASAPGALADAFGVDEAHVHDYGKNWRPGRKLGHVTVTGDILRDVRVKAWRSAGALGTIATMEDM